MSSFNLKPCPICGGMPMGERNASNPPQYRYFCCGIRTDFYKSEQETKEMWNKLVTVDTPQYALNTTVSIIKAQIAKADSGKPILSLVPKQIIYEIEKARRYGTEKYGDPQNWKKVELERYHEALLRHTLAIWDDIQARDKESGLLHLSHMATNIAFILELMNEEEKECGTDV